MKFSLILSNVQHIKELTFNVDLSLNKLMCIVGKNGVGKTTLIRAIKNFQATDTFTRTASPHIFNDNSSIKYIIDDEQYDFEYNPSLQVIDTKKIISEDIKKIFMSNYQFLMVNGLSTFRGLMISMKSLGKIFH